MIFVRDGDQQLPSAVQGLRQPAPPIRIEPGERVVQQHDGRLPQLSLDRPGQRQAKSDHGPPRLAMGGEPPRSEPLDVEPEIIPMRSHERGPAEQLVAPSFRQTGSKGIGQTRRVLAQDEA